MPKNIVEVVQMTDSARSSSSRVAMSIAFKRARSRFPKNFGAKSNAAKTYESSESKDNSEDSEPNHEPSTDSKLIEDIVSYQIDSLLVDSLDTIEISDSTEVLCNQCKNESNNNLSLDLDEVLISDDKEKDENDYDQQLSFSNLNVPENTHKFSPRTTQQNCTTNETDHSFEDLISVEENGLYDNTDEMRKEEISFTETVWHPTEKLASVMFSEVDTGAVYEESSKFQDRPESSSRQKKHRCKKQSSRSCTCHSCSYCAASDCACEDNRPLHSPNCPYYEHCAHCYHHWCRRCCCSGHCCFNRCSFNWHERDRSSIHAAQESRSPTRRLSSGRRKTKRCAACRRGQSSSTSTSSRRGDVCSRDSGIFTNVYYENENYAEDEGVQVSCNTLMHKDSLSILQEKYRSTSGRKRSERKMHQSAMAEDKYRSGKYDASENDDEVYARNSEGHKSCRRLCRRHSNSY